jgi:surface protein
MSWMFNQCHKLKEIKGIDKFITTKVTDMKGMFNKCSELESIDLSNFDTSNVTDMKGMFNKCYNLKKIKGLNNFRTNKIKNMAAMFQYCQEIENLDLSKFNTSNLTDMSFMFNGCNQLKEIKGLDNLDTKKVIYMTALFQSCSELILLDLSSFETFNVS